MWDFTSVPAHQILSYGFFIQFPSSWNSFPPYVLNPQQLWKHFCIQNRRQKKTWYSWPCVYLRIHIFILVCNIYLYIYRYTFMILLVLELNTKSNLSETQWRKGSIENKYNGSLPNNLHKYGIYLKKSNSRDPLSTAKRFKSMWTVVRKMIQLPAEPAHVIVCSMFSFSTFKWH